MNMREDNYTNLSLRSLVGKKVYISKIESGYQHNYLCEVIESFKIVTAKVIEAERWGKFRAGDTITCRPNKCFVYGTAPGEERQRCHWYKDFTSAPS